VKVLLLGGGGFLSSAVEKRLAAADHEITVLNRSARAVRPGTRAVAGDRNNPRNLAELARNGFDGVVDFLCFKRGQAEVAVSAFGGRTRRYVMISTGSVYWCTGQWRNPVGEDQYPRTAVPERRPTPLTPGSVEYGYGLGKREAEDLFAEAEQRGELSCTRLRFPVVSGPDDPSGRYTGYLRRIRDGGPIVVPDGGFNAFRHLYVDDAAAAVEAVLDRPDLAGGGYNVASWEIVSVRDLLRLMAACLGRDEPEVLAMPREWSERWGCHELFAPFSCARDQILDPARAAAALAFTPAPYAEWLATTVEWAVRAQPEGGRAALSRADELDLARRLTGLLGAA
jgi:nucleoside-diphosphate-sugar epimerase